MSILDALINQYGNSSANPYARPVAAAPVAAAPSTGQSPSVLSLINMLGNGPSNPYATPTQGLTAPQIVPIDQAEADRAIAQQGGGIAPALQTAAAAPRIAAMQAQAAQAPITQPQAAPQPAAPQAQLPQQQVQDSPVAQADAQPGFPTPSDYNADGTQASAAPDAGPNGGLLGALAGTAQQAVSDPSQSKGLLSALGDTMGDIGNKLKGMSPAASQGLIAAGLTMLAGNDGRHNLAQLAGAGGIAGLNQYQTVTQNSIANRIAQQKMAVDLWNHQIANQVAQQNAATEAYRATHPVVSAGQTVLGPNGSGGMTAVGSGGVKAEGSIEQANGDGSTTTFKTDTAGQIIPGTGVVSKNPNVGPLNPDQLKVVNEAQTEAQKQAYGVQRTQMLMSKLSPTMLDPTTGKQVPNPDYINVPGGLTMKGQDMWTKLTGDQTTGQVLRNEMQQQAYQQFLATWKPGIGGRLTNTDVNLLKQGMPPDTAGGATWYKFLSAYGKLQQDMADHAQRQAAFVSQNRGDMSPLRAPLTFNGVTYPAGSTYAQVSAGQGGTMAQQPGQNGGSGVPVQNSAIIEELRRRGVKI